jgi:hypothetical protein
MVKLYFDGRMAGNTVSELNTNLTLFTDELTILTSSIKDSQSSQSTDNSQNLSMKKDIRDLKGKADSDDRRFEEEEGRLQAYGGKSRKQTLQEFTIFFFFVAYAILTIAFLLYAHKAGFSTVKVMASMVFILLIITGIIIIYT